MGSYIIFQSKTPWSLYFPYGAVRQMTKQSSMEPQKLWVVIWVGLSGHWQKQEINETKWEVRKGKCDWFRWGRRPRGCTQLITSSGSPNTVSSLPFYLHLLLPVSWLIPSLPFCSFLPSLSNLFLSLSTLQSISESPNKLLLLFSSLSLAVWLVVLLISPFSQ